MIDLVKWLLGVGITFILLLIAIGKIVANISKRISNNEVQIETIKKEATRMETRTDRKIDGLSSKIRELRQSNNATHEGMVVDMKEMIKSMSDIREDIATIKGYMEGQKEKVG